MKGLLRVVLLAALALGVSSCRRGTVRRVPERTCVVLSVGGTKGLAHLGALDALTERGVRVDCVMGNSMGAVVGSLYTSAPSGDLRRRYQAFFSRYERETSREAAERGTVGAAVGFLAVILSGGTLAPALAVGALGAAGGAATVPRLSHERFTQVLDTFYRGAYIEHLLVPFATSYQEPTGQGLQRIIVTTGPIAGAVAASVANPFVFPDASLERIDPGADRVSAVPVHDACQLFPGARLIAINVTGEPAFYRPDMGCEVREIFVDTGNPPPEAFTGRGAAFNSAYTAGYEAITRALDEQPL
jgi:NTE family protein